ncbi:MAG: amino acid ABC transporter permease [Chloroflexota bacterium]
MAIREDLPIRTPEAVVTEINAARARENLRFRLIFGLTWLVLIGLLVGGLIAAGKVDSAFLGEWAPYILGGIPITIVASIFSIAMAVVFAVLGALGRLSVRPVIYAVATLYVSLVRGTPLIVQILFIYLALPQIIPAAAGIPAIALAIFALAFNYGAYMTEIFRAGIQAIPRSQVEASAALGMTDAQTMRRIILPQAIRIVIPAIGNEFIAMIKDSALVSIIGVQELLWRAQRVGQSNFRALETLLLAALVYWVLTIAFSLIQDRLEKRMAESDRRI